MILYAVYHLRRMLKPYAHGNALGLHFYFRFIQISVDITCRMTCGQYHRTAESELHARPEVYSLDAFDLVACYYKPCHLGLVMHFAARFQYRVPHVFYHPRQSVGTDVRMGIGQYGRRSTVLAEHIENLLRISAFLAAGIEFAVGVCACSAFAETIVGIRVYYIFAGYGCHVFAS